IGAGLLGLATTGTTTAYPLLCAMYLPLGAGWGLINTPVTNLAISAMPAAQAGVASALAGTARQVGTVLGVALLGALASTSLRQQPVDAPTASRAAALVGAIHVGYLVGALAAPLIVVVAAGALYRGARRR